MISNELALALWERAASCRIGIAVPTNDVVYLVQTLYVARQSLDDDRYAHLTLIKAKGEVWIVDRKAAEDAVREVEEGNVEPLRR
jgi:hypothetical protein